MVGPEGVACWSVRQGASPCLACMHACTQLSTGASAAERTCGTCGPPGSLAESRLGLLPDLRAAPGPLGTLKGTPGNRSAPLDLGYANWNTKYLGLPACFKACGLIKSTGTVLCGACKCFAGAHMLELSVSNSACMPNPPPAAAL